MMESVMHQIPLEPILESHVEAVEPNVTWPLCTLEFLENVIDQAWSEVNVFYPHANRLLKNIFSSSQSF